VNGIIGYNLRLFSLFYCVCQLISPAKSQIRGRAASKNVTVFYCLLAISIIYFGEWIAWSNDQLLGTDGEIEKVLLLSHLF